MAYNNNISCMKQIERNRTTREAIIEHDRKYFFEHLNHEGGDGYSEEVTTKCSSYRDDDIVRHKCCCKFKAVKSNRQNPHEIHRDMRRKYKEHSKQRHHECLPEKLGRLYDDDEEYDREIQNIKMSPVFHEESSRKSNPIPPIAQSSRSILNTMKIVHKMKPKWEEMLAENQESVERSRYYTRNRVNHTNQDHLKCHTCNEGIQRGREHRNNQSQTTRQFVDGNQLEFESKDNYVRMASKEKKLRHASRRSLSTSDSESDHDDRNRRSRTKLGISKLKTRREPSRDLKYDKLNHRIIRLEKKQERGFVQLEKKEHPLTQYNKEEEELDEGSSEWDYSNESDSKRLSPSRYEYNMKRNVFSPQKAQSPDERQEQKRSRAKISQMESKNELESTTERNHEIFRKYQDYNSKTEHTSENNRNVTVEIQKKENLFQEEKNENDFKDIIQVNKETSHFVNEGRMTQSEGGRRIPKEKDTSSAYYTDRRLMLSKFSQTQAELELDFELLKKYPPKNESRYSQTDKIEISKLHKDSWEDDWISEISKHKTNKNYTTSNGEKSNTSKKKHIGEISHKTTQIPKDFLTDMEFLTPRNKNTFYDDKNPVLRLSKSTLDPKNTNTNLAPRKSISESANPGAQYGNYKIPIQSLVEKPIQLPEMSELDHTNVSNKSINHYRQNEEKFPSPSVHNKQIHSPRIKSILPHENGLKVLRHSKSLSYTEFYKYNNNADEKSIVSAPPNNRRQHYNENSYKISDEEISDSSIKLLTPSTTSASFAMEQCGQTYQDETIQHLSEMYDNLIGFKTKIKSLDVQDSKIILNDSLEEMKHASIINLNLDRKSPIIKNNLKEKEKFIWRSQSHSFIKGIDETHQNLDKICQECKQIIKEVEECLESKSNKLWWHIDCFQCVKCKVLLNNGNHYLYKKQIFCRQHYGEEINIPKCQGCHEIIFDEKYTMARGVTWHKEHFKCYHCKRPIIDSKYVKSKHDEVLCFDCHKNLVHRKCNTCYLTITPTQEFIQTGEKYWHAKNKCFHCFTCHKSLIHQNRMFEKNGITYCNRYCAVMNIPPV